MPVDVIILNWNAPDDTLSCLRGLSHWEHLPLRIWVVDNGSTDDSVPRIRRTFPQVHLLVSEYNRGFAGGNNLALRHVLDAGADYILLLNNDASITESDAQKLVAHLEHRQDIGFVGPTLWEAQHPARLLSAGGRDIAHHTVTHLQTLPEDESLRTVDYVPGTCLLMRASALREIGLLDEAYFFSGEVADLCTRARQAGWLSVVDVRARATHNLTRSSHLRERLHVYYVLRNRFLFIRKFYPHERWKLWTFWTGYGMYIAMTAMGHGQIQRARAAMLGVWDGLSGRYGGQNRRVLGRNYR